MDVATAADCVMIMYTTLYRDGGEEFKRAAEELERNKRAEFPGRPVVRTALESKKAFEAAMDGVAAEGQVIAELHFIGHSGMYGIMFGSRSWPEQFSPHEWRSMKIPFAEGGRAYFWSCRSGRWFAPFFARTFRVKACGFFWYTTVSSKPDRFSWRRAGTDGAAYIISVPGKKSHGLLGSIRKFIVRPRSYPLLEFSPPPELVDTTYDAVAALYDETFEDISVRADELRWLRQQLAPLSGPTLLDVGCGTGSFLRAIEDLVERAEGVDISAPMVERARNRATGGEGKLNFTKIDGPRLPFADDTFDVVTSVLSFRYLDWDPIVAEALRVLKPGGRLFIIDMVAAPARWRHWPRMFIDKARQLLTQRKHPEYRTALRRMVEDPRWKKMLEYNPIRAEHEMKWYLESRFPGGRLQVLNYGWNSRVLAFASLPLQNKKVAELTYP